MEMRGFGQVVVPVQQRSNEHRFVPVEHQLNFLGLNTRRALRRLRGKQVVDVGCGNGDLVKYLREQGIEAIGIDYLILILRYLLELRNLSLLINL